MDAHSVDHDGPNSMKDPCGGNRCITAKNVLQDNLMQIDLTSPVQKDLKSGIESMKDPPEKISKSKRKRLRRKMAKMKDIGKEGKPSINELNKNTEDSSDGNLCMATKNNLQDRLMPVDLTLAAQEELKAGRESNKVPAEESPKRKKKKKKKKRREMMSLGDKTGLRSPNILNETMEVSGASNLPVTSCDLLDRLKRADLYLVTLEKLKIDKRSTKNSAEGNQKRKRNRKKGGKIKVASDKAEQQSAMDVCKTHNLFTVAENNLQDSHIRVDLTFPIQEQKKMDISSTKNTAEERLERKKKRKEKGKVMAPSDKAERQRSMDVRKTEYLSIAAENNLPKTPMQVDLILPTEEQIKTDISSMKNSAEETPENRKKRKKKGKTMALRDKTEQQSPMEVCETENFSVAAKNNIQDTPAQVSLTLQTQEHIKSDISSNKTVNEVSAARKKKRKKKAKANNEDASLSMDHLDVASNMRLSNGGEINMIKIRGQDSGVSGKKEQKPLDWKDLSLPMLENGNFECPSAKSDFTKRKENSGKVHEDDQDLMLPDLPTDVSGNRQYSDFSETIGAATRISSTDIKPCVSGSQHKPTMTVTIENATENIGKCKSSAKMECASSYMKHGPSEIVDEAHCLPMVSCLVPKIVSRSSSKRKLLVLDVNGLLADIVMPPPKDRVADVRILGRAIYKRPFYHDFLKFCFQRFDVGIWSSRSKKVIDKVVDYILGDLKKKLLFCWDMKQTTKSRFKTLENRHKPLVCKELRKLWEKHYPGLPWDKGDYNESNTLLLDDSPYKALLNPVHTAIFPNSYCYKDNNDNSLGPGGDLRVYLEDLLTTENIQEFVSQHPYGQKAIDETNSSWRFYSRVIQSLSAKR